MDKRSKVNSQLSDKVYDVTLDDVEPADFEFTSDLYKVNVFGIREVTHLFPYALMPQYVLLIVISITECE